MQRPSDGQVPFPIPAAMPAMHGLGMTPFDFVMAAQALHSYGQWGFVPPMVGYTQQPPPISWHLHSQNFANPSVASVPWAPVTDGVAGEELPNPSIAVRPARLPPCEHRRRPPTAALEFTDSSGAFRLPLAAAARPRRYSAPPFAAAASDRLTQSLEAMATVRANHSEMVGLLRRVRKLAAYGYIATLEANIACRQIVCGEPATDAATNLSILDAGASLRHRVFPMVQHVVTHAHLHGAYFPGSATFVAHRTVPGAAAHGGATLEPPATQELAMVMDDPLHSGAAPWERSGLREGVDHKGPQPPVVFARLPQADPRAATGYSLGHGGPAHTADAPFGRGAVTAPSNTMRSLRASRFVQPNTGRETDLSPLHASQQTPSHPQPHHVHWQPVLAVASTPIMKHEDHDSSASPLTPPEAVNLVRELTTSVAAASLGASAGVSPGHAPAVPKPPDAPSNTPRGAAAARLARIAALSSAVPGKRNRPPTASTHRTRATDASAMSESQADATAELGLRQGAEEDVSPRSQVQDPTPHAYARLLSSLATSETHHTSAPVPPAVHDHAAPSATLRVVAYSSEAGGIVGTPEMDTLAAHKTMDANAGRTEAAAPLSIARHRGSSPVAQSDSPIAAVAAPHTSSPDTSGRVPFSSFGSSGTGFSAQAHASARLHTFTSSRDSGHPGLRLRAHRDASRQEEGPDAPTPATESAQLSPALISQSLPFIAAALPASTAERWPAARPRMPGHAFLLESGESPTGWQHGAGRHVLADLQDDPFASRESNTFVVGGRVAPAIRSTLPALTSPPVAHSSAWRAAAPSSERDGLERRLPVLDPIAEHAQASVSAPRITVSVEGDQPVRETSPRGRLGRPATKRVARAAGAELAPSGGYGLPSAPGADTVSQAQTLIPATVKLSQAGGASKDVPMALAMTAQGPVLLAPMSARDVFTTHGAVSRSGEVQVNVAKGSSMQMPAGANPAVLRTLPVAGYASSGAMGPHDAARPPFVLSASTLPQTGLAQPAGTALMMSHMSSALRAAGTGVLSSLPVSHAREPDLAHAHAQQTFAAAPHAHPLRHGPPVGHYTTAGSAGR